MSNHNHNYQHQDKNKLTKNSPEQEEPEETYNEINKESNELGNIESVIQTTESSEPRDEDKMADEKLILAEIESHCTEPEFPIQVDKSITQESFCPNEIKEGDNSKYFFIETMVTAGPRKNFNENAKDSDFGLGEDVAGTLVMRDKVYFWVLDGTSDSPILKKNDDKEEYFSSRLLAQTIAWELQFACTANKARKSIEILKEAIENTQVDLKTNIEELSDKDKEGLIQKLKIQNNIMCSTTVIFGSLDINGKLDVSRIGDSRIVTKPAHKQEDKTGRAFAILINNGDFFEVAFNPFEDTKCQIIEMEGVETVIAMSDGISKLSEKWLNAIPKLNLSDINIRRTIAQTQQLTCDDKSMCIIQIRN